MPRPVLRVAFKLATRLYKGRPRLTCPASFVPCIPQASHRPARRRVERYVVPIQEGPQLVPVHRVMLRIDLPDKRLRSPLRQHTGILTTREIDIACPQKFIVTLLLDERQHAHLQGSTGVSLARARRDIAEILPGLWQNPPLRHQTQHRLAPSE